MNVSFVETMYYETAVQSLCVGAPVTLQAIMKRHSLTDEQLNCEIGDGDIPYLAMHFDGVSPYCHVMELSAAEQADLNELYHKNGTQVAMTDCLILWKRREPSTSTYGALLCILLRLGKGDIAHKVGNFMAGGECACIHGCMYNCI